MDKHFDVLKGELFGFSDSEEEEKVKEEPAPMSINHEAEEYDISARPTIPVYQGGDYGVDEGELAPVSEVDAFAN